MAEALDASLELIDHHDVDWSRVRRTAYLVHQFLRYEYPGPIQNLQQQLIVFPPDTHGDQRLIGRHLQVSIPGPSLREDSDQFGNRVCHLSLPRIERAIEFDIRVLVERTAHSGGVDAGAIRARHYARPSPLTEPDNHLKETAVRLAAVHSEQSLVERVNHWVNQAITYTRGVTDVKTTAAAALALGQGVCQDYAHVMLALCRLLDIPARYVSGHLLGEGGTHAWVEVLAADPRAGSRPTVQAFDPTHGRRCRPDYITVAVGRDYADVAPTSGTFVAPYGGRLISHKMAGLTALEYFQAA